MRVNSIIKQMQETSRDSPCRNRGVPVWNHPIEEVTAEHHVTMTTGDYLANLKGKMGDFRDMIYRELRLDMDLEDEEDTLEDDTNVN